MNITEKDFTEAAQRAGLPLDHANAVWIELKKRPDRAEGRFEAAHVAYYFGALLVIGAMGWFMTEGWDAFGGFGLAAVASLYAGVFILVGNGVWKMPMFRVAGGLLITMAVCMVPLAVYGVERAIGWWPEADPGSYTRFHPYIHASWVVMEGATVIAAVIALRFYKFGFITAPAAYALWYASMDVTALLLGRSWTWQDRCMISAMFGAIMMLVAYKVDGHSETDLAFWGYLFGLLTFTGGLTAMESGSQIGKLMYCLIHVGFIGVALLLRRKVFLVFGGFGVFAYLCNEAYTYFRNSIAFPFVLSALGIVMIYGAMQYKKRERQMEERLRQWFGREVFRIG